MPYVIRMPCSSLLHNKYMYNWLLSSTIILVLHFIFWCLYHDTFRMSPLICIIYDSATVWITVHSAPAYTYVLKRMWAIFPTYVAHTIMQPIHLQCEAPFCSQMNGGVASLIQNDRVSLGIQQDRNWLNLPSNCRTMQGCVAIWIL